MLFYVIFISQIVFISWYLPKKMKQRMQKVIQDYPENQYPKLYVKSTQEHQLLAHRYGLMNHILMIVGMCVLSAIITWEYLNKTSISPMVPWAYFMLQMIPLVMLEIRACQSFKIMRKSNTLSTKQASIKPRRVLDFISLQLMIIFIISLILAFMLVIYHYDFTQKSLTNITIILFTNVFFAGVMYWNIYGKKMDPYQSEQDRLKVIKLTVTSIVCIGIAVNIFLAAQMLIKIYDVPAMKPIVMSLYCQLIVLMSSYARSHTIKVEDMDFDVYKQDNPKMRSVPPVDEELLGD